MLFKIKEKQLSRDRLQQRKICFLKKLAITLIRGFRDLTRLCMNPNSYPAEFIEPNLSSRINRE